MSGHAIPSSWSCLPNLPIYTDKTTHVTTPLTPFENVRGTSPRSSSPTIPYHGGTASPSSFHQVVRAGPLVQLQDNPSNSDHGRGGSPILALGDGDEAYELSDYRRIQAQRVHDAKQARRAEKRLEKRRWLEEQDEMKFSHSIQFNAVPDWSDRYLAYSNLKKL